MAESNIEGTIETEAPPAAETTESILSRSRAAVESVSTGLKLAPRRRKQVQAVATLIVLAMTARASTASVSSRPQTDEGQPPGVHLYLPEVLRQSGPKLSPSRGIPTKTSPLPTAPSPPPLFRSSPPAETTPTEAQTNTIITTSQAAQLEQFLTAAYKVDPRNDELVKYYSDYYQEGFLSLMTNNVSFDSLFLGLREFHQILDLDHTQPDTYLRFLNGCQVSGIGTPAETQIKDALDTLVEIHRQMPIISVYSLVDNLPVFFQHGFSRQQIIKTLEAAAALTPAESHYFLPDQVASLLRAGAQVESLPNYLTLINELAKASGKNHQDIASAVDYSLNNYAFPAKKLPELLRRAAVISHEYRQRGDATETTSLAFELLAYQMSHGYSPQTIGVDEIRAFEEFMPSQSSMRHPILEILTPTGANISGAVSPENLFSKISAAYNQDTEGPRVMDSEKIGAFLSQIHEWSINARPNDEARTNFVNEFTPASAYRLLADASPGLALEIIPTHHSLYTSSVELLLARLDRLETKALAAVFENDKQFLPGFAVTAGHFGQLGKFVNLFPETFLPPIRNAIENSTNPLLTLLDLESGITAGLESRSSTDYQNLVVHLHQHYLQTKRWSDAAATAFLIHSQSETFLQGPQNRFVAQELRRWPAPDFDPELPEWKNSSSYNVVLKYIKEDEDVPGAIDYFPSQGYQLTQVDARNWQAVKKFPNGKSVKIYITFNRFTEAVEGPIHLFAGLGHSYRYSEMFTPRIKTMT